MLFAKKTHAEPSPLVAVRQSIIEELVKQTAGTPEHKSLIADLKTVSELLNQEKPWEFKPDANTLFNGGLTLAMTLIVTKFEILNPLTTKAASFLPKLIR